MSFSVKFGLIYDVKIPEKSIPGVRTWFYIYTHIWCLYDLLVNCNLFTSCYLICLFTGKVTNNDVPVDNPLFDENNFIFNMNVSF